MKKRNKTLQATCVALSLLGLFACSDKDELNDGNAEKQSYTYEIELTANNNGNDEGSSSAKDMTRTLEPDENNDIVSNWAVGDKVFVYNLSDNDRSTELSYSLMTAKSANGKIATFKGVITSRQKMNTTDKLAFFYPADALEEPRTVEQVDPTIHSETAGSGANKNTIEYHVSPKDKTIKSTVLLNMTKQDGTLKTIDKKFDYNWGVTSPELITVSGNQSRLLKASVSLQRKVSFWGLRFKKSDGTFISDIDSVKVYGLRSYDVLSLKDGSFVGTDDEKEHHINITIKDKAAIAAQGGFVWLAFLAENESTNFTVTVYTPQGAFSKSASKLFKSNFDYRTNVTVNNIVPKPFIEVNGVKWATGNFIHYVKGGKEYWGIAPAQWWISSYGENPGPEHKANGKEIKYNGLGSQYWYVDNHMGRFSQTANDLDLFQWGVIKDALKFNGVYYLLGFSSYDLAGKYFNERGNIVENPTPINDRNAATHGDIVKYWTEDGKHTYHYQYPSDANFESLFRASTIIPAYCYTDKGNKIYGAYFSDTRYAGMSPKPKFPTGRKLWKYQDVTGLVVANQGLFLPIAGRRPIRSAFVEFRHTAENSGFYGQYYTAQSTTYSIPHGVFFGAAFKMNIAVPSKDQGSAIRPVYVGTDDESKPVDAANFEPFHNIITPLERKY